jgi:hypothetical protein
MPRDFRTIRQHSENTLIYEQSNEKYDQLPTSGTTFEYKDML